MNTIRIILVSVFIGITVCCLSGCDGNGKREKENQTAKEQAIKDNQKKIEAARLKKIDRLRIEIGGQLYVLAFIYAGITLLGPTILEKTRKIVTKQFKISKDNQIVLAVSLYSLIVMVAIFFAFNNPNLIPVQQGVLILLAASCYPFLAHIIPSIKTEDKVRMKAALTQIKSLFFIIVVFYIIFRFISPEGFGQIMLG
jgi:hypothetical protein